MLLASEPPGVRKLLAALRNLKKDGPCCPDHIVGTTGGVACPMPTPLGITPQRK